MAKQTEKKKKYVVLKKHTLDYEVGQVVELTETKAKALTGKVRLQGDVVKDTASVDEIKALKKENAELKAEVATYKELLAESEGRAGPDVPTPAGPIESKSK